LSKFVWYKPIGKQRTITIVFPIPFPEENNPNYLKSPLKYIGYLLSNKGDDTLF